MGIAEDDKREKGAEKIIEIIMVENFSKLITETKPQIQEVHTTQNRINTKSLYLAISYSNCRKPKTSRKIFKI